MKTKPKVKAVVREHKGKEKRKSVVSKAVDLLKDVIDTYKVSKAVAVRTLSERVNLMKSEIKYKVDGIHSNGFKMLLCFNNGDLNLNGKENDLNKIKIFSNSNEIKASNPSRRIATYKGYKLTDTHALKTFKGEISSKKFDKFTLAKIKK